MTDERFNELVSGVQGRHSTFLTRRALLAALRCVVEAHPGGEEALEAWCVKRRAWTKRPIREQQSLESPEKR